MGNELIARKDEGRIFPHGTKSNDIVGSGIENTPHNQWSTVI